MKSVYVCIICMSFAFFTGCDDRGQIVNIHSTRASPVEEVIPEKIVQKMIPLGDSWFEKTCMKATFEADLTVINAKIHYIRDLMEVLDKHEESLILSIEQVPAKELHFRILPSMRIRLKEDLHNAIDRRDRLLLKISHLEPQITNSQIQKENVMESYDSSHIIKSLSAEVQEALHKLNINYDIQLRTLDLTTLNLPLTDYNRLNAAIGHIDTEHDIPDIKPFLGIPETEVNNKDLEEDI